MTATVRHGRWEDALADVRPDTVIVDAPYSDRVHAGALQRPARFDGVERTPISYACWGKHEVDAFVESWAPRTACWIVSITDHLLMPLWLDAYDRAGLYHFAPVGIVITGMGCRIVG